MGGRSLPPLRSLPRVFLAGIPDPVDGAVDLPDEECDKFRKVLRLKSGDEIAILPGDGRLIRARLDGRQAAPFETSFPHTEPSLRLTLALALTKPDALEASVRMASEIGAQKFALFPSDRTVVRWEENKRGHKIGRLRKIAREAAEVSFRTILPTVEWLGSLREALESNGEVLVLSESESTLARLQPPVGETLTLVIGPEGGWSPNETKLIGDRARTLGPRVLRAETAVAVSCGLVLNRD